VQGTYKSQSEPAGSRGYCAVILNTALAWGSQVDRMPSFNQLVKASVSLGSLKSTVPETVSFTGTTGNQLFGYFSGWTSKLQLQTTNCKKLPLESLLAPLTVFTATQNAVTCDWVQQQVEVYKTYDDVFEEAFLQSESRKCH
jgi:hypothetical protein